MHTTKATILLGALLSAGMLCAQTPDPNQAAAPQAAQSGQATPHREANPDKMAAHLGKKLNLSNDQISQIKPILADRQQQMESLRSDTTLSRQDRRAKAQAIQQDSKGKIEALLNDTQKQQYEQMLAERREHHKEHGAA